MAKKISELTSATTLDGTEILPLVQGGVTKQATVSDLVSGGELPAYDTSETLTTNRWIDGKPLYRKVVTGTASADDFNVASGVTGYEYISIVHHSVKTTSGRIYSASGSYFNSGSSEGRLYFNTTNDEIMFMFGSSANSTISGQTYYVVLEYTKTADTASSPVAGVTIAGGDSDWTEPSLTSSWQILSNDNQYRIEYRKDSAGVVHIRGLAQALDQNTVNVFTLPIGYRPAVVHSVATPSNTGGGTSVRLYIFSNGQVNIGAFASGTPAVANNSWASVSASFYADQ